MKNIFLTLGLFIGLVSYSQEITNDTQQEDIGIYKATVFHDNGQVAQTGFITLDKKNHGIWKAYDTDGNLKSMGEYNNGEKVGVWVFWDTSIKDKFNYTKVEFGSGSKIDNVYYSNNDIQLANNDIED